MKPFSVNGTPLQGKASVFVCVPTRGNIDAAFHISMVRTMEAFRDAKIPMQANVRICGGDLGGSREEYVYRALQSSCTHVMFIDDDMGWEEETPIRLLLSGFDFCAAIAPQRRDGGKLCFTPMPGDPVIDPATGFLDALHVGFGLVMLHRSVLERMGAHYRRELAYVADDGTPRDALFLNMIEAGVRYSEDYSFCRRWKAMGGQIWVDPHARMCHAGRNEWIGCVADALEQEPVSVAAE